MAKSVNAAYPLRSAPIYDNRSGFNVKATGCQRKFESWQWQGNYETNLDRSMWNALLPLIRNTIIVDVAILDRVYTLRYVAKYSCCELTHTANFDIYIIILLNTKIFWWELQFCKDIKQHILKLNNSSIRKNFTFSRRQN